MPDEVKSAIDQALEKQKIDLLWRQWAFDHASLRLRDRSIESAFAEAEQILRWMFKKPRDVG